MALTPQEKTVRGDILVTIRDWVKSKIAKYTTVTLTVAGWDSSTKKQNVTVSGLDISTMLAYPVVDDSCQTVAEECDVKVSGHSGSNVIIFKCETIPTSAITVHIAMIKN